MALPELRYKCPSTGARFLSTHTCAARLAKAGDKKAVTVGIVFEQHDMSYEFCAKCSGPTLISDGSQEIVEPVMPRARWVSPNGTISYQDDGIAAAKERKKLILAGKPLDRSKMSKTAQFKAMKPHELWTGTTCGCRKPRSEFYKMSICRECENKNRRPHVPRPERKTTSPSQCTVCGKPASAMGLCKNHYMVQFRLDRKNGTRVIRTQEPAIRRFMALNNDEMWTGTRCGCTKPRSQFQRMERCRACKAADTRRRYAEKRGNNGTTKQSGCQ